MKKKLLFFLLTAVCALVCAPPALAWNFETKNDPGQVKLVVENGGVGNSDTYIPCDFSNKTWSCEFTPLKSSINLKIQLFNSNGSYNQLYGSNSASTFEWHTQNDNNSFYTLSGLTAGKKYIFELVGQNGGNGDSFKWRVSPVPVLDFSSDENLKSIKVVNSKGFADFSLTFANGKWTGSFTTTDDWINFGIEAGGFKYHVSSSVKKDQWYTCSDPVTDSLSDSNTYYSNLGKNKKFIFELEALTTDTSKFRFRIIDFAAAPAAPTFSVAGGTIYKPIEVTINVPTGSTVRYTTNGTNPTSTSGTVYTAYEKIPIDKTTTLKAIATNANGSSTVATATYTFGNVYFYHKVGGGDSWTNGGKLTYSNGKYVLEYVTLKMGEYFIFGKNNKTSGSPWNDLGVTAHPSGGKDKKLKSDVTEWPLGTASAWVADEAMSVKVTLDFAANKAYFEYKGVKPQKPQLSKTGGTISNTTYVELSCPTSGATIYYTTDNTDPKTSASRKSATGSVSLLIEQSTTVRAIAEKGDLWSDEMSYKFVYKVATPALSKGTSTITVATEVTVSCASSGAIIHYTTDGTEPTTSSPTVANNGKVSIPAATTTLKVKAFKDGCTESATASATYTYADPSLKAYYFVWGTGDNENPTFAIAADSPKFTWNESEQAYVLNFPNGVGKEGHCAIVIKEGSTNYVCGYTDNGNSLNLKIGVNQEVYSNSTKKLYSYSGDLATSTPVKLKLTGERDFMDGSNNKCKAINLEITEMPAIVNLPLSPSDFNSGPKYFLVGTRLGSYRLQPEWMFEEKDGALTLPGRFMYRGKFAVARVNNYSDYTKHIYDLLYVSSKPTYNGTSSTQTITATLNSSQVSFNGHEARKTDNAMTFACCGDGAGTDDPAKNSVGVWCEKMTLDVSGTPKLTIQINNDAAIRSQHRVFQLVGSDIYHPTYHRGSTFTFDGHSMTVTTRNSENADYNGWEQGWIQYNTNNRPYFDAYHTYLYHTEYSNLTFNADHKSLFRINVGTDEKPDYRDFDSEMITFKNAATEGYTEDASDPYREYYKHFVGGEKTIKDGKVSNVGTGAAKDTEYDFTISGAGDTGVTASDWQCYVVKNVYLKGEFKFWTGWGGNRITDEGGTDTNTAARWNSMNGGAETIAGTSITAAAGIFNSGESQTLTTYRNYQDKGAGSNYKREDLTFYNRVILWYSPTKGFGDSFLQFIQEKASPAIQAKLQDGKDNLGEGTWTIINTTGRENTVLKSFKIDRYRMGRGSYEFNGNVVPETKFSDGYTIGDFLSEFSSGKPFTDSKELGAGVFYYSVTVTYSDGATGEGGSTPDSQKMVYSNPLYVYDNAAIVSPMCSITQMVRLEKKGFDYLQTKTDVNTNAKVFDGATYDSSYGTIYCMTYRPASAGADVRYYVMSYDTNASSEANPIGAVCEISTDDYHTIMKDTDSYTWTAYFFVRALNLDLWNSRVEQGIASSSYVSATYTNPEVTDNGAQNEAGNTVAFTTTTYPITVGGIKYLGTLLDRKGVLRSDQVSVNFSWTVNLSDDQSRTDGATASAIIYPEVPKPRVMEYKYVYRYDEADKGTPITDMVNAGKDDAEKVNAKNVLMKMTTRNAAGDFTTVTVPESDLLTRHLDCYIKLDRPNVSQRIFELYNIYYDIEFNTEVVNVPGDNNYQANLSQLPERNFDHINGTYYDEHEYSRDPYIIAVRDVHPYAYAVPRMRITGVKYTNKKDASRVLEANYGDDVDMTAKQNISRVFSITDLGLGVNAAVKDQSGDNTKDKGPWSWFIVAHKELVNELEFNEGDADNKNRDFKLIQVEATVGDETVLSVIPHNHDGWKENAEGWWMCNTGLVGDENLASPIYIGTFGDENSACDAPKITMTPVYTFLRAPLAENGKPNADVTITTLTKVGATPAAAPRRAADSKDADYTNQKFVPKANLISGPDDNGVYTYDATQDPDVVLFRGATDTKENANVMTGIEDVTIDQANGTVEYYNLQGMRVANPEPGHIYIKRVGNTATKVRF